jgi:hypothetical protein
VRQNRLLAFPRLGDTEKIVEPHYKTRLGRQQERLARVPIRNGDYQARRHVRVARYLR